MPRNGTAWQAGRRARRSDQAAGVGLPRLLTTGRGAAPTKAPPRKCTSPLGRRLVGTTAMAPTSSCAQGGQQIQIGKLVRLSHSSKL